MSAGEMRNSNSVTSWLLASAGLDVDAAGRRGVAGLRGGTPVCVHARRPNSRFVMANDPVGAVRPRVDLEASII